MRSPCRRILTADRALPPRARSRCSPKPQPPAEARSARDVTGKWTMALEMSQGTATPTLELKQDGEKLTGTYTGRYGEFAAHRAR